MMTSDPPAARWAVAATLLRLPWVLVDAAADAGAEVLHRTLVRELLRDRHGRVSGDRAEGPHGRVTLPATVTVGADGIRSTVAEQTGARVPERGTRAGATLYRYVEGLAAEGYAWAYGDRAAAGVIRTGDGLCCSFVSTAPARLHRLRRTALVGEAAMLHGDLPKAEQELTSAVALHREIDAPAGEAHNLQRLAEVRLRQGRTVEARELLEQAVPLARWSLVADQHAPAPTDLRLPDLRRPGSTRSPGCRGSGRGHARRRGALPVLRRDARRAHRRGVRRRRGPAAGSALSRRGPEFGGYPAP